MADLATHVYNENTTLEHIINHLDDFKGLTDLKKLLQTQFSSKLINKNSYTKISNHFKENCTPHKKTLNVWKLTWQAWQNNSIDLRKKQAT